MAERMQRLNAYLTGWVQYFALAETPSLFDELDEWLRRRLRRGRWKGWKRGATRKHNFLKLGLPEWAAWAGYSRKEPWRMAASPTLMRTLDNAYWQREGFLSIAERYAVARNA